MKFSKRIVLAISAAGLLAGPIPAIAKTAICHLKKDKYVLQFVGDQMVAKHLAHGDSFPGSPAPGTESVETIFASAWSDTWP